MGDNLMFPEIYQTIKAGELSKYSSHGGFHSDKLVFWHNIVIIGVGRGRPRILRNFEKCWDGPPHYFI